MDQGLASMLTGLTTGITKYLDLGNEYKLKNAAEQQKQEAELNSGKQLAQFKASTDLAKDSALKLYEQTIAGKVDPDTAAAIHPEAAKAVEAYNKANGRYPTVEEAHKLFDNLGKKDDQRSKQLDLNDQRMNRFIQKHSENLTKAGIPALINSYNELADVFSNGKDVKGVGVVDSHIPNIFLGDEGNRNRTNLQQLANTVLQQRSGAAVSDQEYARFLKELQAGKLPAEAAIKTHLGKIGKDLKSLVGTYESGLPKDALDEYGNRPGAIKSADIKDMEYKPSGPAVGTVSKGYRFKGGNPSDKSSWEKV